MRFTEKYQAVSFGTLDVTIELINALLAAVHHASSTNELKPALGRLCEALHIDAFGQLFLPEYSPAQAQFVAHTDNLAAYGQHYVTENLIVRDPISLRALHGTQPVPFGFKHQRQHLSRQERTIYHLLDAHGIRCGMLLPMHAHDSLSLFKLGFHQEDSQLTERLPALATLAQMFALHIHHATRRLSGYPDEPHITLTRREQECLMWSAAGKTAWEISQILGVAEPTVIFHLENAKKKLDARTLPQAIAKSIRLGLMLLVGR